MTMTSGLARTRLLAVIDIGCVAFKSMMFSCDRSMLDCEPSDIEDIPSDTDRGGVSIPELEVQVLDLERAAGPG
jgi:hypothetical protein